MIDEIRALYEKTKLKKGSIDLSSNRNIPITWTKVFYKEYPRLEQVDLPRDQTELKEDMLSKRKSEREYINRGISLNDLAAVLNSCRIVDVESERRTYPSAGARFPIETYPIVFNIEGVKRGAYHYNIKRGTLELLWETDLRENSQDIVSPFVMNPSAALVLTSVLARQEVKYGAKAYPFSLIEAGHMGQNMMLAAQVRDISSCPVGGFVDEVVAKILDLTQDEIPIYVIALGKV